MYVLGSGCFLLLVMGLSLGYKANFALMRVNMKTISRPALVRLSSAVGGEERGSPITMNEVGENGEDIYDAEIRRDIKMLVNIFIDAEKSSADGFRSVNPSLLLDNSHVLTKGRIYEGVMEELLQADGDGRADTAIIERVDAFLTGFIHSERKSRSKLKLNYIIAGASSNRLESAIGMLSETDQIDDDLLMFIDALIRKKKMLTTGKALGSMSGYDALDDEGLPNPGGGERPSMTGEEKDEDSRVHGDDDDDVVGLGEGNDAVAVLQMVRRRLVAEVRTGDKPELRLLAALLAEPDISQHEKMIKAQLVKVEQMERFETFLENGINHLSAEDAQTTGDDEGESARQPFALDVESHNGAKDGTDREVAPDTVEKMKDVLVTLRGVMKMFGDRDIFEVKADDAVIFTEEDQEGEE